MPKLWILAAFLAGLVLAGPAFSHAKLRSSVPAADTQLAATPKSLTLNFNESVRIAVLTLSAGGKDIALPVDRSASPAAQVTVALPALAPGKYQVVWSVLSAGDGHVSKGAFAFAVTGPAAIAAAPAASQ